MSKTCIFIGNRPKVFGELESFKGLTLKHAFVLKGSLLSKRRRFNCEYSLFGSADRSKVVEQIGRIDFDILISSGCPFLLPVDKIGGKARMFLNVHPSYLPDFRGLHPANAVFLNGAKYAGATMHFMDASADTGSIVYQERFRLTPDIDLGLLYMLLFDLEAEVFRKGMRRLMRSSFRSRRRKKRSIGSYYTRKQTDMYVDFIKMDGHEIIRKVRAFDLSTQGAIAMIEGDTYKIFDAEEIANPALLKKFKHYPAGSILCKYDKRMLVKCGSNGIIKLKSFSKI